MQSPLPYEDVDGLSIGKYSQVVDGRSWRTTFRADGILSLDFLLVSVREIVPLR
jgi:hypothetical protein